MSVYSVHAHPELISAGRIGWVNPSFENNHRGFGVGWGCLGEQGVAGGTISRSACRNKAAQREHLFLIEARTRARFLFAVLLFFVRINEKSSRAQGVISVLGVK